MYVFTCTIFFSAEEEYCKSITEISKHFINCNIKKKKKRKQNQMSNRKMIKSEWSLFDIWYNGYYKLIFY